MLPATRQKWMEACISLGNDENALVECPNCGARYLRCEDIAPEGIKLARRIFCDSCGQHSSLSYTISGGKSADHAK